MDDVRELSEERLAELLALLRPAPLGWVEAAEALPATLADLDDVLGRLHRDEDFRSRFEENPAEALGAAGLPATATVVAAVRTQLHSSG
jgi:hypothetical protein